MVIYKNVIHLELVVVHLAKYKAAINVLVLHQLAGNVETTK